MRIEQRMKKRLFDQLNKEDGSVTIEATISLSAFMFAIVTILTIVNICLAQAKIAYAINTTAKEISQYSYLYSLTGLNDRQADIYNAGKNQTASVDNILKNVNETYNEIEKIAGTADQTNINTDDLAGKWDEIKGSVDNIKNAGSSIKGDIESIASDPKSLIFGIAKLASSEAFDLAKSRLIAAPISKALCKRHLVNEEGGDPEAFLKHLGVVPSASGSYVDGLDFSQSTLFPYGTDEITVNVSYDIKVVALLIDFKFHFNQTARTNGWMAGEVSFKTAEQYKDNNTLWTQSTVQERASLIRHLVIADKEDEGYEKTAGLTDVQLYNSSTNEFAMISSMNPLYSSSEEEPLTLDDLDDEALKLQIERLCAKMKSTTDGVDSITTKRTDKNGQVIKTDNNCAGATNRIILIIPEDSGLKEKIESIISEANTSGVTIEVNASFGTGVNKISDNDGGEE